MFCTSRFVFDGIPCELYGVSLCSFENASKQTDKLGVDIEVIEERLPRMTTPIHYGINVNSPLTFTLTFGSFDYLDKYQTAEISGWLTGHAQYKWLEIEQPDMTYLRYRCLINNLQQISVNGMAVGFSCDVLCDSQFAYSYEMTKEFIVDGALDVTFVNTSTFNGYIYPALIFFPDLSTTEISVVNHSDQGRDCRISGLISEPGLTVTLDNKNQIISHNGSINKNLYNRFNNRFFRLLRGENKLTFTGSGKVIMKYMFLHSIGG